MAEVQFDRVQETTSLVGTGDVPLGGASAGGFVTFSSVMANADTSRFVIYDPVASAWEVFAGVYNSSANTLSRTTVEASSNAGGKVAFAGNAGTYVFMDSSATFVRSLAPKLAPVFQQQITIQGYAACVVSGFGQISMNPGDGTHTGYVGFFDKSGTRQGFIGFGSVNGTLSLNAEAGTTGWTMQGTFYSSGNISTAGGGFFNNNLQCYDNDTTGNNLTAFQILSQNNPSGANIKLVGNGTATPSKYLRVQNGQFHVVNNAYSAVIMSVDDGGNFTVNGTGTFQNRLVVSDSSNGSITNGLQVYAPNNAQGANIQLTGSGSAPNKYIRSQTGNFQVINNAYNSVLLSVDDSGNLSLAGKFDQLTTETNRAIAAENIKPNRNLLHNGRFAINQRGVGRVGGTSIGSTYGLDRWQIACDTSSTLYVTKGTASDGDRSALGDESVSNYVALDVTGGSGTDAYALFFQNIEGVKKTAGKQITLTFTARGDRALNATVDFQQQFGNGGSPSAAVSAFTGAKVALTTNWQTYRITGTCASTSGKTFGTNPTGAGDSLCLYIWVSGVNSGQYATRNQGITPQTGTVFIAGAIKVEIGNASTAIAPSDDVADLAECRRFYQQIQIFNQITTTAANQVMSASGYGSPMRSTYSFTTVNNFNSSGLSFSGFQGLANGGMIGTAQCGAAGQYTLNMVVALSADF